MTTKTERNMKKAVKIGVLSGVIYFIFGYVYNLPLKITVMFPQDSFMRLFSEFVLGWIINIPMRIGTHILSPDLLVGIPAMIVGVVGWVFIGFIISFIFFQLKWKRRRAEYRKATMAERGTRK